MSTAHVRSGAVQRGAWRTVSRGRDDDLPRWHPRRRAQTIATSDRPRTSVEDCTSGTAKRRHAWRQPRGCSGTGSGDGAGATVKSSGGSAGLAGRTGGGNSCVRDGSSCTDGGRINGGGGRPGSQEHAVQATHQPSGRRGPTSRGVRAATAPTHPHRAGGREQAQAPGPTARSAPPATPACPAAARARRDEVRAKHAKRRAQPVWYVHSQRARQLDVAERHDVACAPCSTLPLLQG